MSTILRSTVPSISSATQAPSTTVADAIEQTLEWLDRQGCGQVENGSPQARRGRYRVAARITYLPPGADKRMSFEVTTRNLSRSGLSFIHKTLIYPRQHVEVQLPLPDRSVRQLCGTVAKIKPAGTGEYEIEVEFTELEVAVA